MKEIIFITLFALIPSIGFSQNLTKPDLIPGGGQVGNGTESCDSRLMDARIQAASMLDKVDLSKLDQVQISDEAKNILRIRKNEMTAQLRDTTIRIFAVSGPLKIDNRVVDGIAYRDRRTVEYDQAKCESSPLLKISYILLQENVHLLPLSDAYPAGINDDKDGVILEVANAIVLLSSSSNDVRTALVSILVSEDRKQIPNENIQKAAENENVYRGITALLREMPRDLNGVPNSRWSELVAAQHRIENRSLFGTRDSKAMAIDDATIASFILDFGSQTIPARTLSSEQYERLFQAITPDESSALSRVPLTKISSTIDALAVKYGILERMPAQTPEDLQTTLYHLENDAISLFCQVDGSIHSGKVYVKISNCRTRSSLPQATAFENRVLSNLEYSATATRVLDLAVIASDFSKLIEGKIKSEGLNPSSDKDAKISGFSIQLFDFENNGVDFENLKKYPARSDCHGSFTATVLHFTGEQKPITENDKKVLPILFNMGSYFDSKAAVLSDLKTLSQTMPTLRAPEFDPAREENYVISLGAGHASKAFFELLKNYFEKNGVDGKVIYRSTLVKTRWQNSNFEGNDRHQILQENMNLPIEYYGIPGSHIYVFRMLGPNEEDCSNFGIVTNMTVFRVSYSEHTVRDANVTSHWTVDKNYVNDLQEVLTKSPTKMSEGSFRLKNSSSKYSDDFSINAPKLYR